MKKGGLVERIKDMAGDAYLNLAVAGKLLKNSPKHLYSTTASLALAGSLVACDKVMAPNLKPTAEAICTPTAGYSPLTVNCNASQSRDQDGSIVKYVWDFGHGNMDSTSGANVSHVYPVSGNYIPKLTVVDNGGEKASKTLEQVVVQPEYQIAFSSIIIPATVEGDQVYTINSDGSGLIKLTNGHQNIMPEWSKDGSKLAYQSNRDGIFAAYVRDLDGSERRLIQNTNLRIMSPSWSPNNQQIGVFYSAIDSSGIGITNLDGSGFRSLSREELGNTIQSLSFSPDGNKIAYTTKGESIYLINSDGSNRQRLIDSNAISPKWLPDSSGILFLIRSLTRENEWDVAIKYLDGRPLKIFDIVGTEADPDISPDGKKVIWANYNDSNFYLRNLDGTGKIDTVKTVGFARFPTFRPKR